MNNTILGEPWIKHIHFIGIGGISMSGLAQIMSRLNYKVSGSDIRTTHITDKLEREGIKVFSYHSEDNLKNADLVVYTAAVKEDNPELVKARQLKIPAIERCVLLGELSKKYEYCIAVSGTHGKTTTTSMIATILLEASFDPTLHIGGELKSIGGTTRIGGNRYFLTEACEYNEGFLKLNPYIALILNIEDEHPDFFKNIEDTKSTFSKLASQISSNGYLVACISDQNTASILKNLDCNIITYGIGVENADWTASDIEFDDKGCACFNLVYNHTMVAEIKLNVPGLHNVSNSLASIAASYLLGCDLEHIRQGIYKYKGVGRRFEIKGVIDNIKVIDDYAHHPSEVKATLNAARRCCDSKIWCVFQPHTFTRTKAFLTQFSESFSDADVIIVSDIYAAREKDPGDVHSSNLTEKINLLGKQSIYITKFDSIVKYLLANVSSGDLIITMGAGDIYKVGEMFIQSKEKRKE